MISEASWYEISLFDIHLYTHNIHQKVILFSKYMNLSEENSFMTKQIAIMVIAYMCGTRPKV